MEWKDQHQGQHVPQLLPVPAGVWCEGSEVKAHPFVLGMELRGGSWASFYSGQGFVACACLPGTERDREA